LDVRRVKIEAILLTRLHGIQQRGTALWIVQAESARSNRAA